MDEKSQIIIDRRIEQILRELGAKEPPLHLEDVLAFLNLHREYYSLSDPGILDHIGHKLKIGTQKILQIKDKINLQGLFFPSERKILIETEIPDIKKRWITAHELGHAIVPWHDAFLIGDTAETLDPAYHEMIEQEANYAAASLLFMASRFSKEASDYELNIASVKLLSKKYGNSQTMTLRRFVEYSQDKPMVAVISRPYWKLENEQVECRYFIPSRLFKKRFSKIVEGEILEQMRGYTISKSGGPIGGGEFVLLDDNGVAHEFIGDSFFNRYDILTLIVHKGEKKIVV